MTQSEEVPAQTAIFASTAGVNSELSDFDLSAQSSALRESAVAYRLAAGGLSPAAPALTSDRPMNSADETDGEPQAGMASVETAWVDSARAHSGFVFVELDEVTRGHMLAEVKLDLSTHGHLYPSKVLTEQGHSAYAELMLEAVQSFDEVWLTDRLNEDGRVVSEPVDAARRLARTEFNRYYIRGICVRAAAHGSTTVIPYRASKSREPRPESTLLENEAQSAPRILANLRGHAVRGDPASGLGRVNSGMSARCGCRSCLQGP